MLVASRLLRASKFVVGISIKDIGGVQQAIKKAVHLARPGDKIVAVHVPKLVPEMLLSSMNDPSDACEDTIAALKNLPTAAGAGMEKMVMGTADDEMKGLGTKIDIEYKVQKPSSDVKSGLLSACRSEGADFLVIGPGIGGNGSIPPFVTARAKGFTICVVRDSIE
eukprot:TRINITY_DN1428_c0_g1_i2.p1 TRINITY_DN1428_c0_g1~~TRINITY_DN1428_c0_g1_i2.p1  ORF type:complete len:166 (+),score=39.32 TRINITY_DN1428_c0_g1_i2:90-587(+)